MRYFFALIFCLIYLKTYSQIDKSIFLGSETQVSLDSEGGALKCEPSVVISDNIVIVAWNDSYGGKSGCSFGVCIAWAISYDFGNTYQFGGYLSKGENGVYRGADSWLAKDSKGNFYLQVLAFNEALHLYFMDRNALGEWVRLPDPVTSKHADKPFLHIQDNDDLWISFTMDQKIFVISSKDHGQIWTDPVLVSDSTSKSRGVSSITTYRDQVFVSWAEGESISFDELWYNTMNGSMFSNPKLIYKTKNSETLLPPGYSMGFDHKQTSGSVVMFNLSWMNQLDNKSHPVNVVFGSRSNGISKLLLFEFNIKDLIWEEFREVGNITESYYRMLPSSSNTGKHPAILYYDRRNCQTKDCSITDVYLSVLEEETWYDFQINSKSSDWSLVPGDSEYAPFQRNFGDYITLASDGNKLIAVWTDGRNGNTHIYSRWIEFTSHNKK